MNTTNQNLKPITTKINSKEHIEIGGCDLVDLANNYGTPLYVIDEQTIITACNQYKDAFKDYENIRFMFASKSLCTSATAKIISEQGFGFDVVSSGEIYTVKNAGCDMSKVLFNGSNKTYEELVYAIDSGVGRISVDNHNEIEMLSDILTKKDLKVDVLLRITPGIECHTHEYIQTGATDSKFGFDLTQLDEVVSKIVNQFTNIRIRGLHAHIGSQIFETQVYADEIKILAETISKLNKKFNLDLDEMNIGGGLGVKYVESDCPPSMYDIANKIIPAINNAIAEYNLNPIKLIIEPGRSIISPAGVTLYTFGSSKTVPNGKKYIAVDGGMADNIRHALYQAEYSASIANKPNQKDALQKVTIAGRFCESGDVLIKNIELPNPEKGDILCVFNTGAYNYSMASNYNRVQKPAMVLVNNSQSDIIVKRETFEDLVSHDIIPDRWL